MFPFLEMFPKMDTFTYPFLETFPENGYISKLTTVCSTEMGITGNLPAIAIDLHGNSRQFLLNPSIIYLMLDFFWCND